MIRMRNPVDQAWSLAKMTHTARNERGYAGTRDFKHILDECLNHILQCETKIKLWQDRIPPANLHLSFYEDFQKDPKAHLESILSFLDLTWPASGWIEKPIQQKLNVGKEDRYFSHELKQKAAAKVLPHLSKMEDTFGARIVDQWIEKTRHLASPSLPQVES